MGTMKDRRQQGRQRRDERVVVQYASPTHDRLLATTVVRCSTKDVSPRGVRIQLDRQLPERLLLSLCVDISNRRGNVFLAGEVKWCRELADAERSLVGIEFTERQTDDFKRWQQILER
jgi:hypothetical protein